MENVASFIIVCLLVNAPHIASWKMWQASSSFVCWLMHPTLPHGKCGKLHHRLFAG